MSEENQKNELKYKNRKILEEDTNQPQESKRKITFDVYFQGLVKLQKASVHHKAPMRKYAEQNGINKEAYEEEFNKIFDKY